MSNTVLLSTVLYSNFLFTTVSSSTVLSITVLSSTVLSITILSSYVWSITGLSNTVLFSTVLSSTVLSSTVLSSTVLFSTVLSSYVLFITVLSSTVLFCGQVGGATQGRPVGDDRALRQRPQLQGGPQEEGGQVLPPGHGYREAWVQCVELSTGGGLQGMINARNSGVLATLAKMCNIKDFKNPRRTIGKIALLGSYRIWVSRKSHAFVGGHFIQP